MPLDKRVVDLLKTNSGAVTNPYPAVSDLDPDKAGKALQISNQTGIDALIAAHNMPEVEAEREQQFWVDYVKQHPIVSREVAKNPVAAAAVKDALPALGNIEKSIGASGSWSSGATGNWVPERSYGEVVTDTGKSVARSINTLLGTAVESQRYNPATLLIDKLVGVVAPSVAEEKRRQMDTMQTTLGEFGDWWESQKSDDIRARSEAFQKAPLKESIKMLATDPGLVLDQLSNSAAYLIPGAAIGRAGAAATLTFNALAEGFDAAQQARQDAANAGASLEDQDKAATLALVTTAPIAFLGNKLTGAAALESEFFTDGRVRNLVSALLKEGVSGAFEEGGNQLGQNVGASATYDPDRELTAGVAKSAAVGGILEATHGAGMTAISKAADVAYGRIQAEDKAQAIAGKMKELQDVIRAADVVAQRTPETFSQLVQKVAEETGDAPTSVFINANVLNQASIKAGIPLEQLLPTTAEQVELAAALNGDVEIPVGDWATYIATQPIGDDLIPHIKTDPLGMTQDEARIEAEMKMDQFRTDVKNILAMRQSEDAFVQGAHQVEKTMLDQLNAVGRNTPEQNQVYATFVRDMYVSLANRMKMTPDKMYELLPYRVVSEGQAALNQEDKFNTSIVLYRGSKDVETSLRVSTGHDHGVAGISTTPDESYARFHGDNVKKYYARKGDFVDYFDLIKMYEEENGEDSSYDASEEELTQYAKDKGFIGSYLYDPQAGEDYRVFDPSDLVEVDFYNKQDVSNQAEQQINTPEFRRWFGDSKVVDAEGKPLMMYRGMRHDQRNAGVFEPDANGLIFVTPEKRTANRFAGVHSAANENAAQAELAGSLGQSPTIFPVYVSAKNIFDPTNTTDQSLFDMKEFKRLLAQEEGMDQFDVSNTVSDFMRGEWSAVELAQSYGLIPSSIYDGIWVTEGGVRNLAVFNSTQIKSAIGNNGNFDPNDPNILNQRGVQPEGKQVPDSVSNVSGIEPSVKFATSKTFDTNRQFKEELQALVNAAAQEAGVNLAEFSKATEQYLVSMAVNDGKAALKTNANAVGWYNEKVTKALRLISLIHPEIETDPQARFAFTWALAVTSNGLKVDKNFELAEATYNAYKKSSDDPAKRRMPTNIGIGTAAAAINKTLGLYNTLIEKHGFATVENFMTTMQTVKDVEAFTGQKVSGENLTTMVYGAAALGPKIGNGFFMNLYGHFEQLTMDRWLMRTWGRWTGTLIEDFSAQAETKSKQLTQLIKNLSPKDKAKFGAIIKVDLTTESIDMDDVAIAITKASMKPENRVLMAEIGALTDAKIKKLDKILGEAKKGAVRTSIGDEIRKAGNALTKYLDGQKEAPSGPPERGNIRKVFGQALAELQKTNPDLTMSDFQALLWYPEKRLYDSAKTSEGAVDGYEDDEAPDYANAAAKLAKSAGIAEEKISEAIAKVDAELQSSDRSTRTRSGERGSVLNQETRGGFDPASLTTILNKEADLSTFLHETWHFYLEVLTRLSSLEDTPQDIRDDLDKILQWQNIQGATPSERLATWQNMTLDEQRSTHEALAYNGEIYLTTGKAPSVALHSAFQNFFKWLKRVYKSIRDDLNAVYKQEFGKDLPFLTPEIRGVMDRALASEDQIRQAERMRGYMGLFQTQEEADAFDLVLAEYQKLGEEATQAAIEEQTQRSIRDMRWLDNAKSREMKKLQRQSAGLRKIARMQARSEVTNTPVYQAWYFLTGQMDKVEKKPKAKVSKNVDPANDSLFIAISKLGGIDREELISTWGVDPADIPKPMVFGKPLVRAKEGKTIDGMAELLAQYGYLELDDEGKWDLHDFEERFFEELRGNPQLALAGMDSQIMRDAEMRYGTEEQQILDIENMPAGRLNLAEVRAKFGDDANAISKMLRSDGLPVAPVAEFFGFSSADEMIKALIMADDPEVAVDARTDEIMRENHAELATDEDIERSAERAIHNDARARFIATGYAALSRSLGNKTDAVAIIEAARNIAREEIGRKRIRDIKSAPFIAAETKAAKLAKQAMKDGNIEEAAAQTRNQLLSNLLSRTAITSLDDVERAVKYLKKFDKATTRKRIDQSYLDQIDKMLERYELKRVTNRRLDSRASLEAWIKQQEDIGNTPVIPATMLNEMNRVNYRDMTLDEFNELVEAVKNIEHLGRLKERLLTAQDRKNFNAAMKDVVNSIDSNAKKTLEPELETHKNWIRKLQSTGKEFFAMHRKLASIVRVMDGVKDGGPFWNVFIRGMNNAGNQEAVMREKVTIDLTAMFDKILKTGSMTDKVFIPEINNSLSREARITVLLNMGNEGNLQRLMDGDGWTLRQVNAIIDTLSAEDVQFAQEVWDYFESWRPQIAEQQKMITGIEPKWIDPIPVQTKHGTLRGGYFPAKYDGDRSTKAMQLESAQDLNDLMMGKRGKASARASFTNDRAGAVKNRPLRKDFGVIFQHMSEVTHRLAWQPWLIDARRIMGHGEVDRAIREHYGTEVLKVMHDAINDIALGEMQYENAWGRVINYTRTGATIAGLGWNLGTALLQPIGLTQSIVRVGAKWVAKGVSEIISEPTMINEKIDNIYAKSDFMRLRGKTMQREINEIRNQISNKKLSMIEGSFFVMIQKMQAVVDIPTWIGAYEKAIDSGADEAKATAMADQAVLDAQGGGQVKDLAAIQRGSALQKLWTNFYSFFNTTFNLTAESIGRTNFRKPADIGMLAVDFLLLYSIPAVMGSLLKAAIQGDDDDELKDRIWRDQLNYLFGTMVGLRDMATVINGFAGYSGPAGMRFFSEFNKLGKQIGQGEVDEAMLKALNNVGGIILHYPAGQVQRTFEGFNALANGQTNNPLVVLTGPEK